MKTDIRKGFFIWLWLLPFLLLAGVLMAVALTISAGTSHSAFVEVFVSMAVLLVVYWYALGWAAARVMVKRRNSK